MLQIREPVSNKFNQVELKIQFLECWRKIQVKIQDFNTGSCIWGITFHNLKYLDKPDKMPKNESKYKINEIFFCIFTNN